LHGNWVCGDEYCHLFQDVVSSSVHGKEYLQMWKLEREIMGDQIALGLSSLYVKEASRFSFSFLSNFLEIICGIWGGFTMKD